jgi:large subunit ribosomal protein L19
MQSITTRIASVAITRATALPSNTTSLSTIIRHTSPFSSLPQPKPYVPTTQQSFLQTISPSSVHLLPDPKAVVPRATETKNGYPITWAKHISSRKSSNLMYQKILAENTAKSRAAKPSVFKMKWRVGDAIELEYADSLAKGAAVSKQRGVVLGKTRKGVDSAVVIRDVVMGTVIERHVKLHSPLVKSVKVLTHNFVKKGKKKIKRAKLYYLRDRPDSEVRVTG